ncbi:MAG: RNA polymerase sigma factor [Acidobacteriota bacterium]|jgi:RNA polymerase sigma-70 factor (ECF subfamily)|nr:RNA polymerase sigma factor [Acidobacteriota bacterium]
MSEITAVAFSDSSEAASIFEPSNMQDRTLISRTKNGDQVAFEELVQKYRHHLLNLVCWHAGPAADIDDILQAILCKVYFSLKRFDLNRPFYPWLRRIAVNRCFDERRRLRRRKTMTFAELGFDAPNVEPVAAGFYNNYSANENRNDLNDMLAVALRQLPKDYQQVLVLHYLEQLPYEEIAFALDCSPQAARVKACRARAALRRILTNACRDAEIPFASYNLTLILNACQQQSAQKLPMLPVMPHPNGGLAYCN